MQKITSLSQLNWHEIIQENDLVIWGQAQTEPVTLTHHLIQQSHLLKPFNVFLGISNYATCQIQHSENINFSSYCGAGSNRLLAKENKLDIVPIHYSQLTKLLNPDVVIVQVSAPNELGEYSLGLGQDYIYDFIYKAKTVIAEINTCLPWTYSENYLTDADFDISIETSRLIKFEKVITESTVNQKIARYVADLIPNGSTLQIGIGNLPETILSALDQHRDLGIHSGIINDNVAELMSLGVINNTKKKVDTGCSITGLINGSKKLHDFVDHNPNIQLRPTSYTHNPFILSLIDNLVAINSAIEVDLTGQVNSEVAAGTYVGAVGGALDFIRAANQSKFGFSIIALPSTGKNFSRIVSRLNGPVSTPRSDAAIFVTEYGVADLRGLTISQRIQKMIQIAHPDFRAKLIQEAGQIINI